MFKAFATAAAILSIGASGAMAAEVGIRHSAGSSYRSTTNGTSVYNFDGRSVTNTRTNSSAVAERGGLGTASRTRTRTTDVLNFSGRDVNNFTGGSNSVFSENSIFAQ